MKKDIDEAIKKDFDSADLSDVEPGGKYYDAFMASEAEGLAIDLIGKLRTGGMPMRAIAEAMAERGHTGAAALMAFAYAGHRFGME